MALSAKIQFGDNKSQRYLSEYLLVNCRCSFRRSHNDLRPDGLAHCDCIEIDVVAPGKNDLTLYDWFVSEEQQSGRILFDLSSTVSSDFNPTKQLLFENARCFALEENYDQDTRFRRLLRLRFEADTITTDNVEFNN